MKYVLAMICFVGSTSVEERSDDAVSVLQSFTTLRFSNTEHLDFGNEFFESSLVGTWRHGGAHRMTVSASDERNVLIVDTKDSGGSNVQLRIRMLKVRDRVFILATDAPRLTTSIRMSTVCEVLHHDSGEVELFAVQPSVFVDAGFREANVQGTKIIITENGDGTRFLKCLESSTRTSRGLIFNRVDF